MMLLGLKKMEGFHITDGKWEEDGSWVKGSRTSVEIYGNVQYIDDSTKTERMIKDYGLDSSSIVEMFTTSAMTALNQDLQIEGDLVYPFDDGVLFEVFRCEEWLSPSRLLSYRVYAVKKVQDNDAS